MKAALSKCKRFREQTLLAILVIAALLVAPVCAPLCAAKTCRAASLQERCHDASGEDAAQGAVAPKKACGRSELSAVLPKIAGQFFHSQRLQNVLAATATGAHGLAFSRAGFARALSRFAQSGASQIRLDTSESFHDTAVLRI